jgi:hypothetical protein
MIGIYVNYDLWGNLENTTKMTYRSKSARIFLLLEITNIWKTARDDQSYY